MAPSLGPALEAAHLPPHRTAVDRRTLWLCGIGILLGIAGGICAQLLMGLIGLITNLCFYGRVSTEMVSPAGHQLGWLVIFVPVVGAVIIGFMARYGSAAIRGHGIPEAMETVLTKQSRIPARVTLLKPLSAAISIGTGGPFGAEGPIIATGGALGSLLGQIIPVTPSERKTLLAAGAAAGMAATFGSPLSAVLLAVELLLFEYRLRSLIPVAFASITAAAMRISLEGAEPVFAMPDLTQPVGAALAVYVLIGAIVGVCTVGVTRVVYAVEDGFERLPIHWMWWPAIGAVAVGLIGRFVPHTLGVGYDNISNIISGSLTVQTMLLLCGAKFISWAIALGSGTSGGTLAPLFTIGGGIGALLGAACVRLFPQAGVDVRIAALVGMAAIFAGASRALLASAVFAFETTLQPLGLLPLLGGCSAAHLVCCLLSRESIMTEKIARRGIRVPTEYLADPLDQLLVSDVACRDVVSLDGDKRVAEVLEWVRGGSAASSHQGFPVVGASGEVLGVLTRRDLFNADRPGDRRVAELIHRPPCLVYADCTLRQAMDHMLKHDIGRLPVVSRERPYELIGIMTRSDLLSAYRQRLDEAGMNQPAGEK